MTISEKLVLLQQDITNARTAITSKGGQTTPSGGSSQLATDIATIPTGITPSGNIALTATTSTQTGINVTNYATASVAPTPSESKTLTLGSSAPSTVTPTSGKYLSSVPVSIDSTVIKAENIAQGATILGIAGTHSGGGSTLYGLDVNDWMGTDSNGTLQNKDFSGKNELRFTGLKDLAVAYALAYRFYTNTNLPSIIFPDLEEISQYGLYYAFSNGSAQSNSEFRMPKLKRVENYGLNYVCNGVLGINYVELGNSENEMAVTGSYNFTYGFYNCNLDNGFVVKGLKYLNISTACSYMFASVNTKSNWTEDTPVEFTDLVGVGGLNALQYVLKSRGANEGKKWNVFPKLTTVNATTALTSAFRNMSFNTLGTYPQKQHIITFPSLQTLAGNNVCSNFMLAIMGKWKYLWFPMLKTIGVANSAQYGFFSSAFNGTAVNNYFEMCFPELENILSTSTGTTASYSCFASDTQIKKFWMPKLKNVTGTPNATYMFRNCTQSGLEIHFGIENQSYIESLAGYASKFGATNATIYFSCVNHITVNGTVYDRDGEHYITECPVIQTSGGEMTHPDDRYSWKDTNGNIVYTLECWTPAVGDNVYDENDTVVGTIGAIA